MLFEEISRFFSGNPITSQLLATYSHMPHELVALLLCCPRHSTPYVLLIQNFAKAGIQCSSYVLVVSRRLEPARQSKPMFHEPSIQSRTALGLNLGPAPDLMQTWLAMTKPQDVVGPMRYPQPHAANYRQTERTAGTTMHECGTPGTLLNRSQGVLLTVA